MLENTVILTSNLIKMQTIQASGYPIYFGLEGYEAVNKLLAEKNYSSLYIIVDSNTNTFCLHRLLPYLAVDCAIEIIEIEAGEAHKNIDTCVALWSILSDFGADRKSCILNLGGGVVTDMGGFVASTFKRGIDFINIPTTLLGMVDASVGGKNGIDLNNLKNQIGTINTPIALLIDTHYLETLSAREMRSGLAEMLKHGLIFDRNYWNKFKKLETLDTSMLDELIYESIVIKNTIVTQDPHEKGIRKSLNFGHTLGHGIESFYLGSQNELLHGEAVAVGMVLEAYLSYKKEYINLEEYLEIKEYMLSIFDKIAISTSDVDAIIDLLKHDKKNEYGKIQFSLLKNIGECIINQIVDDKLIQEAFFDYNS